ncbi:MAG: hypothetical protein JKX69_02950 [Rhodobacteraceae bacterium]|nr:hypothetical protein [Paracoccaceae bacterium]
MRPLLPGDLDAAVRLALPLRADQRAGALRLLLQQADTADRYRKRLGRAHPAYGDGSLMAAAQGGARLPLPAYCNRAYCTTLASVLAAIELWRRRETNDQKP